MTRNFRLEKAELELELTIVDEQEAAEQVTRFRNYSAIPEVQLRQAEVNLVRAGLRKKLAQLVVDEIKAE